MEREIPGFRPLDGIVSSIPCVGKAHIPPDIKQPFVQLGKPILVVFCLIQFASLNSGICPPPPPTQPQQNYTHKEVKQHTRKSFPKQPHLAY
jgi:hypothetical protein